MTRRDRQTLRAVAVLLLSGAGVVACAAREPSRSQAPRAVTWAVFVDDLHLDFRNTGRIRDLVRRIGTQVIRDGDTFSVTSSGPSTVAVPFTTDRARFAEAVKRVSGNGLRPSDFLTDNGSADAFSEVRYRARLSLSTAQKTMSELASLRLSGRRAEPKAFIYLSNGYYIDAAADGPTDPATSAGRRAPPAISVKELRVLLASFSDLARRGRIKVFAIDVRLAMPTLDLDIGSAWPPNYLSITQQSLRALTERTGGRPLLERNILTTGLTQINQTMRGGP